MCLKCISFLNKNFRIGPFLKGQSGNRKHKIYSIWPYLFIHTNETLGKKLSIKFWTECFIPPPPDSMYCISFASTNLESLPCDGTSLQDCNDLQHAGQINNLKLEMSPIDSNCQNYLQAKWKH